MKMRTFSMNITILIILRKKNTLRRIALFIFYCDEKKSHSLKIDKSEYYIHICIFTTEYLYIQYTTYIPKHTKLKVPIYC